ncbi:hypothetical protein ACFO1B_36740 [Dactylosporangium siamense]|uniref:Uncharacterized protein n=1 Tax=Dactylosporangium siamense TaxID=685454 RepID=A0A919PVH4_9ACTN|nr:hypothetical protein [Dactylosporangium siamense]GIG49313.1 hypothetical protein Dsi01nite_073540 [Dactylosporangium siamense]
MTTRWSGSSAGEVTAALEAFARRIGVFDPVSGSIGGASGAGGGGAGGGGAGGSGDSGSGDSGAAGVEVRVDGGAVVLLSPGVARAFVEALRAYQDPRDRGSCDHCGGPRLDDNFICADCGQPSGLFGQLLRERAARYEGPAGELGGGLGG